jgi:ABC-type nickel/cobalt efflux system permease component RcnA
MMGKNKGEWVMSGFWKKLKSRKFLAAMAGVIVGLCMAFGLDEGTVSSVAGAVVSVASVVSYIMTEGKVDAAAVKKAVEDVQTAEKAVKE